MERERNPGTVNRRKRHPDHYGAWKVRLILDVNPAWDDLYAHLA
jgi:hypothetical protein